MGEFFILPGTLLLRTCSPVECVHAAMKFQEALFSRNEAIEQGPKLEWRVGIRR